jgi:anaerobic selenocysteine-containing dehydrogenase
VEDKLPAPKLTARQSIAATATVDTNLPLTVLVSDPRSVALVSPILSKIYQESKLRLGPGIAAMNPADARDCGVEDGASAFLEAPRGRLAIAVTIDPGMPPGLVALAAGEEVLEICGAQTRGRVVRS